MSSVADHPRREHTYTEVVPLRAIAEKVNRRYGVPRSRQQEKYGEEPPTIGGYTVSMGAVVARSTVDTHELLAELSRLGLLERTTATQNELDKVAETHQVIPRSKAELDAAKALFRGFQLAAFGLIAASTLVLFSNLGLGIFGLYVGIAVYFLGHVAYYMTAGVTSTFGPRGSAYAAFCFLGLAAAVLVQLVFG